MNTSIFQPFYNSSGICTDTRSIQENSLFICIKGDNFDGNTFASQAIESGASHVIIDNPSYFVDNGTMTLVENSIKYLQKLANFHRNKFDIPVIGITGSNGKTTTKELILEVLSKKYNVKFENTILSKTKKCYELKSWMKRRAARTNKDGQGQAAIYLQKQQT